MKKQRLAPKDYEQRMQLMAELKKTQNALDSAYSVFENVTDPDLIDCSIYQINAIQLRYKYLLERAKQHSPEATNENITSPETVIYKYSELVH